MLSWIDNHLKKAVQLSFLQYGASLRVSYHHVREIPKYMSVVFWCYCLHDILLGHDFVLHREAVWHDTPVRAQINFCQ